MPTNKIVQKQQQKHNERKEQKERKEKLDLSSLTLLYQQIQSDLLDEPEMWNELLDPHTHLVILGYSTCPFYQKAMKLAQQLPPTVVVKTYLFQNDDWKHHHRQKTPLVYLLNKYIGGSDDLAKRIKPK